MPCPPIGPFLWEPWGRDQGDNATCEPALYGLDKDSSDTEEFTKQTGEAAISGRLYVWCAHLVSGEVFWGVKLPGIFQSDFPLHHVPKEQPTLTNFIKDGRQSYSLLMSFSSPLQIILRFKCLFSHMKQFLTLFFFCRKDGFCLDQWVNGV